MSAKKADKPRYWLAYLLKDLAVGDTFKPDVLHLTFAPWFVTECSHSEVIESFKAKFGNEKPFEIVVGAKGQFKNKRKIPVNLIKSSSDLDNLHQKSLQWFSELEARWAVKSPHVGPEFIAHIRRRQGHNLTQGDKVTVSSLSLVSAHRRGDELRTVIAKVDLE